MSTDLNYKKKAVSTINQSCLDGRFVSKSHESDFALLIHETEPTAKCLQHRDFGALATTAEEIAYSKRRQKLLALCHQATSQAWR